MSEPTGRTGNRTYWTLHDGAIDVSCYASRLQENQSRAQLMPAHVGIFANEGALGSLTPATAQQLADALHAAADAAEAPIKIRAE
ncbi:hypothetical protein HYG77_25370 [Rhodococcus sp. ZPP]|uniref:hypothetical protein n=1 Tax=Rhodococcus sp. ZPP TaxID=2749906 RepID=UPI001AD89E46|nr:hypothetical protein [Rhodococcus sp. ZPP]QTJ68565.1 hypothetical protein HYG77_25370 [Rhodococcus sp. ZPP]